jgi:hypothetical protein
MGHVNNNLCYIKSYAVTFSINYFSLTVQVTTVANCGTSLTRTLTVVMLLGEKVYVAYGNCLIPRTVACCVLLITAFLFSTNYVAAFLIFLALVLHIIVLLFASSPSYGIVHARNCSRIGQNVLYCFER